MALTLANISDCCSTPCPCSDSLIGALGTFLVPDIATLRALPTLSTNKFAWVGSSNTFWGAYVWNNASTAADDGISIIMPSDAPTAGRWMKQV